MQLTAIKLMPKRLTYTPLLLLAQRGMSMMELMVGLAIGMVLTLGMFTMIVSTSQSFRVNDDFSRMQENAASAFRYLGESLRQAGFYGNARDLGRILPVAGFPVTTTVDCGSAAIPPAANFALDLATPIRAYMTFTPPTVNAAFPCIRQANFSAGPGGIVTRNPILVTRGASGFRICWAIVTGLASPPDCPNTTSLLANQPNNATTIYVQADPYQGQLFYGANYAALRAGPTARKYPFSLNDVEMFEYRAHVYYIRPCSRPNAGAVDCTGALDDNGRPIPTLVRQELAGSNMVEVPLVEGIELIDYRFGVDITGPAGNPDGVADFYTANIVTATQWAQVVSVKVTLLVRSPNIDIEYDDSGKQYDLLGDNATVMYRCTNSPAPACRYKRKVFSQTIQLRNIAQRNGA